MNRHEITILAIILIVGAISVFFLMNSQTEGRSIEGATQKIQKATITRDTIKIAKQIQEIENPIDYAKTAPETPYSCKIDCECTLKLKSIGTSTPITSGYQDEYSGMYKEGSHTADCSKTETITFTIYPEYCPKDPEMACKMDTRCRDPQVINKLKEKVEECKKQRRVEYDPRTGNYVPYYPTFEDKPIEFSSTASVTK